MDIRGVWRTLADSSAITYFCVGYDYEEGYRFRDHAGQRPAQ